MSVAFQKKLKELAEGSTPKPKGKRVRKKVKGGAPKTDDRREKLIAMSHLELVDMLMDKPAKKVKKKRALTGYNLFTKENYDSVRDIPSKERMAALAKMWNKLDEEGKMSWKSKASKV